MTVKDTATSSAVKYTLPAAAAAAGYFGVKITDTNKAILGDNLKTAATYWYTVCSYAAAATSCSVSTSHAALGNGLKSYSVTASTAGTATIGISATAAVVTVTGGTPVTTGTNTVTATPAGPIAASAKGTITLSANVTDQFGVAIPNAAVSFSVTGRNTIAATSKITDADGNVTFTYTDAGTLSVNDIATFSYTAVSTAATDTVTVTYSNAPVSTVTISGGNYSAGVLLQTTQTKDISAGDGAEGGAVSITATVKDSNGALLVGVPVKFGVTGTGVAITSTTASGYTDATGVATAKVYAWKAGTYSYTATAGSVTSTGTITFGQTAAGEERSISVKYNGNGIVTATAVDRFGNPVPNVTIYGTGTTGLVINSKTKDSGTTGVDGTLDFVVAGTGTFTASTISWAAAAGTYGSGQTSAPKGYLYNSTSATTLATYAFTATTAGTTLVDETGVGASFDAAGVSSATVDVTTTASDAVAAGVALIVT